MADFVAVIRRAVDGLTENNPEMRVKVYERARGAVTRQLESMKPRPPEDMLRRQLEKLEAAIVEVEAEHAEALPAAEEPVAEAPVVQEEPQAALPEEPHVVEEHPVDEPEPVAAETHAEEEVSAYASEHEEPAHEDAAPVHHEPEQAWHEAPQEQELVTAHHAEAYVEPVHEEVHQDEPQHPAEELPPAVEPEQVAPQKPHVIHVSPDDVISQVEEIWAEVGAPSKPADVEPVMPAAAFTPTPFGHPVEEPASETDKGFAWDADVFEELQPSQAAKPAQPTRQMPDNAFDDVDLFSDVHAAPKATSKDEADSDGWRELKELAGFDKLAGEGERGASVPPDLDQDMAARLQGKSFRMEPKRRRVSVVGIVATLIGLAAVAGGGYAAWLNREALNKMVTDLISSAPQTTATGTPSTSNTANGSAPGASTPATAPAQTSNGAGQQPAVGNTNVAALDNDPNTVSTKFTQRLLANGSEEDAGPAAGGPSGVAEGKSVAEQNVASTAPAATAPTAPANGADAGQAQAPAATPPAADQQASAGTQQAAPVTDGQKVFLYEERLGQTSPTAFQGTVTWSLQEGKGADGRPEPSVQGLINVPERGLTATITVSRNSDASLPASHLVELAFQVPPNFEGGAIDNVQRIALKSTEQDRGDALIAVPAKVTDDVYMVALNDFPDARKTNLDLLKSRNWIDIPVVYRNGRRALLTMEKGPTGSDAFSKAIAEWQALGGMASSGQ